MDIDNNEGVSLGLYVHKVITALTSNQMCHNSFFRCKVPVNADSRSSPFSFSGKSTKEPKSRSQYLDRLKILVLSMHLLETYNVVGVRELLEIFEFEL